MNSELKLALENEKTNTKTPILHWTGLILFLFFFVLPIITSLIAGATQN